MIGIPGNRQAEQKNNSASPRGIMPSAPGAATPATSSGPRVPLQTWLSHGNRTHLEHRNLPEPLITPAGKTGDYAIQFKRQQHRRYRFYRQAATKAEGIDIDDVVAEVFQQ